MENALAESSTLSSDQHVNHQGNSETTVKASSSGEEVVQQCGRAEQETSEENIQIFCTFLKKSMRLCHGAVSAVESSQDSGGNSNQFQQSMQMYFRILKESISICHGIDSNINPSQGRNSNQLQEALEERNRRVWSEPSYQ